MLKITHNKLENLIKQVYNKKLPLFVHGAVGIGKSQTTKKVAKEIAINEKREFLEWNKISEESKRDLLNDSSKVFIFADVRASEIDPIDLKGLPNFHGDYVEWKPNLLFKILSKEETRGIILFDEINLAPPSVLNSLFKIILDREIGELSLNENIGLFACGNRSEDNSGVFDLPSALANRFLHIELDEPNKESWIKYAIDNDFDTRITSFIDWKGSYLFKFDKYKDLTFATPRIWGYVNTLIKDNKISNEELKILVSSSVGEGIAIEFVNFVKLQQKLDIKNLLNSPSEIEKIKEISQKYALLGAVAELIRENPTNVKQFEKCISLTNYLNPEFSVLLLRYIRQNFIAGYSKKYQKNESDSREEWIEFISDIPSWMEIQSKYQEYL